MFYIGGILFQTGAPRKQLHLPQGVRESPEGGLHYSPEAHEKISSLCKQQPQHFSYLSTKNILELNTRVEVKEIAIQTDLDMVGMNKLTGLDDVTNSVEFFSPLPRSIPERLRKHNSIDLSSVVSCDGVYSSEVAAEVPEIVEESVIEPSLLQKRFDLLEPASLPISYEDADENSLSEYSNGGSANLTVDDGERSRDENNNEKPTTTDTLSPDFSSPEGVKKSPVNLFVANIIEYGRSDISSDSDTDKQSYSRSRRKRVLQRRSRTSVEHDKGREEGGSKNSDNDLKSNKSDNESNKSGDFSGRRRRHGVSAEPVRVSWSTLRESFKKLQMSSTLKDMELEHEQQNVDDSESQTGQCDDVDTSGISPKEVSDQQLDSMIQNIPAIEINNENGQSVQYSETTKSAVDYGGETQFTFCVPPNSPSPSQQSGAIAATKTPQQLVTSLDFSVQEYIDDKELEKRFNNLVFTFKTDIYTLQKRLDAQERARDVAEASMEKEILKLSETIENAQQLGRESEEYEQNLSLLSRQSNILRKAAMKVSAQSEQHGSYQQENRGYQSFEMVIKYTEALRFNLSKMKSELDELRTHYETHSGHEYSTEYSTAREDKSTDNDFPRTEVVEPLSRSSEDQPLVKPSSPCPSFSSISKSLMMARGLAKLRKRITTENECAERPLLALSPGEKNSPLKRVQFGETSFSQEREDERGDSEASNSLYQRIQNSTIPKQIVQSLRRYFPLMLTLFVLCILFYTLVRSLEVDTLKLHDKLLQMIPHTIEPSQHKSKIPNTKR